VAAPSISSQSVDSARVSVWSPKGADAAQTLSRSAPVFRKVVKSSRLATRRFVVTELACFHIALRSALAVDLEGSSLARPGAARTAVAAAWRTVPISSSRSMIGDTWKSIAAFATSRLETRP
jgi:hypothetical protein